MVAIETPWALDNLPPFPAVATRLLQVLSKEDVAISDIAKVVAAEPVFATRVLQTANSPLFAIRKQVTAIPQAIVLLGLERVKAITVTRAMGDFVAPALAIKTLRACWQNSLAGAILAEKLAVACRMDPDIAYLAGLLRDIGRLALLVKYPEPYANLLAVSDEHGYDLMATERELFDVDHCTAGAWLVQKMPFPNELREVVAWHHEPQLGPPFRTVHLVHTADLIADVIGFSVMPTAKQPEFDDVLKTLPEGVKPRFAHDPEELRIEIAQKIQDWA